MRQKLQNMILVVDDDLGILESFEVMLGDDYGLRMADNGSTALEMLKRHHPRLLFLDLKIPRPSGLEVLEQMQIMGLDTCVVIVTALPQKHYQEKATRLGVFRYLSKPLDVDEIIHITHRVLH